MNELMKPSEIQRAFDCIVGQKKIEPHAPQMPTAGRNPTMQINLDHDNPTFGFDGQTYRCKWLKLEFELREDDDEPRQ